MNKMFINIIFVCVFIMAILSVSSSIYLYILYTGQENAFNRDKAIIIKNFDEIQISLNEKMQLIDDTMREMDSLKELINDKANIIIHLQEKITVLEQTIAAQDHNFEQAKARLESVEGGLEKVLMDIEDTVKNLDNFTEFEHGWRQDYNKALMDLLARVKQVNSEVKAICDLYDIKFEYVEAAN
jgi:chromosome segregation ATPase